MTNDLPAFADVTAPAEPDSDMPAVVPHVSTTDVADIDAARLGDTGADDATTQDTDQDRNQDQATEDLVDGDDRIQSTDRPDDPDYPDHLDDPDNLDRAFDVIEPEIPAGADADTAQGLLAASLGRLLAPARWFATRLDQPGPAQRPRLVLIAGDHDGPDLPPADLDSVRGLVARLADRAGVGLREEDLALRADGLVESAEFKIRQSHHRSVDADVLTTQQAVAAVTAGRKIADQEIDSGADLLIPGLIGSGHAVALGVLTAELSGMEPVQAVSISDGDAGLWASVVADLRDSLFRLRDEDGDTDAVSLLVAVGGADVAALAGFCAQAAVRRTPVLLDGLPVTVAAVLAHRLAPRAESWFIAAGQAHTRPGRRLQEMLGLTTVADLDTDSAFAAGALLTVPLIQAALAELADHRAVITADGSDAR